MLNKPLLAIFAALVLSTTALQAGEQATLPTPAAVKDEDVDSRFLELFQPFRTEKAALSPDGKYIAYTLREGEMLSVVVLEVDNPAKAISKVTVITDEAATPMLDIQAKEKTPGAIYWMRWITPTRLVVETNRCFPYNADLNVKDPGQSSSWFNSIGEVLAFDADGKNALSLATPRKTAEAFDGAGAKSHSMPRTPHVVDLCDDDPNSIWVQAEGFPREAGVRFVERFKLNVDTGKLSSLGSHPVDLDKAYLFDRKGMPRVSVPTTTAYPFPHRFVCESNSVFKREQPLEKIVTEKALAVFELTPENFFAHRSVPVGFGRDSDILYYASNIGRDTYGLYGIDLKTGKRTTFQAESSIYDLYSPTAGVFPHTNRGTFRNSDAAAEATQSVIDDTESGVDVPITEQAGAYNPTQYSEIQRTAAADAQIARMDRTQLSGAAISSRLANQAKISSLLGNPDAAPLVFDRFTHDIVGIRYEGTTQTYSWFNPSIAEAQKYLEKMFAGRSVDVVDWDSNYKRYLVRVRGTVDSGAFYIYDSAKPRISEFVQRAPGLSREKLHETNDFSFTDASGLLISGTFTFPRAARSVPIPAIVICQPQPWSRIHNDFQPDLQAYAEMGFAVIQVNTRGAWGFGVKQRDGVVKGAYETVQTADIISSIDYLAKRYAINRKRVAIVGKSHGGYLALRALQLYPDRFRCAVAIDSPLDIKSWMKETRWTSGDAGPMLLSAFFGDTAKLPESELLSKPATITKPTLLMNYRGEAGKAESITYIRAKSLQMSLSRNKVPSEIFDLSDDYVNGLPRAKAEAFRKVEDFLNTYIYDFNVKMGDLKIIKQD